MRTEKQPFLRKNAHPNKIKKMETEKYRLPLVSRIRTAQHGKGQRNTGRTKHLHARQQIRLLNLTTLVDFGGLHRFLYSTLVFRC